MPARPKSPDKKTTPDLHVPMGVDGFSDDYLSVAADGLRIRQVLIGLFASAVHFAPEDGTIDVKLKAVEKGSAELTIHDAGVGVDPGALPYLFSRQRQQDPSRSSARAKFGRGLGLV